MLKAKLKALLSDVDNQLSTLEKLGIKCAKRNGTVDDFDQKKLPLMLGMINAIVDDKELELDWEAFR